MNHIEKAKIVHGDSYDYSKAIVKNSIITYICLKHGNVTQSVHKHLKGQGCGKCYLGSMKNRILDKNKDAIRILKEERGDRYDYSLSVYTASKGLIDIICKEHGIFRQRYDHHRSGSNCQICANELRSEYLTQSFSVFKTKAESVHGNKYNYFEADMGRKKKVTIECNKCDSLFKQLPSSHISGNGCPVCNTGETIGFKKSEFIALAESKNKGKATFYVIRCFDDKECFYKVGITTRSVESRLKNKIPYSYEIINTIVDNVRTIWELEKRAIKENSLYHYTPLKNFNGSTKECFSQIGRLS